MSKKEWKMGHEYIKGVPKKSRLDYTAYYAGSEYKVKIREMKFLGI